MILTAGTFFAFQYFGQREQDAVKEQITDVGRGQSYHIPSPEELQAPLNKEIDFIDKKMKGREQLTTIVTPRYELLFTNFGGALAQARFPERRGKEGTPLRTIHHKDFFSR